MRVTTRIFAIGAMTAHIMACPDADHSRQPDLPRDEWSILGRMGTAGYRQGQILALSIDGTRYQSKIHNDNTFSIQLPGNTTYAIHFMSPLRKMKILKGLRPPYSLWMLVLT